MATSSRRTVSRKPSTSKSLKNATSSADSLAGDFTTKLAIGNPDPKLSAMLSVNTASQDLSKVIQSGWKKSSSSSRATLQSTTSSASAAVKHVALLRKLSPDDVDVERAAASILGKLVALELFDLAVIALTEMHPPLCRLLNMEIDTQACQERLLMLPRPPSLPTNPIILTLISTYLLHAVIIYARSGTITTNALAKTLNSPNSASLLAWVPSLTSLPTKHMDSLLTRAYTSLTKLALSPTPVPKTHLKSTSAVDPSPEAIFILRMYALRCLVHTSLGTVETNMVWDQVARFTTTFVKATASDVALEERCTAIVLSAYADLVERVEKRPDSDTFMAIDQKGNGFLGFCEYWMEFTKRAGDICVLQKINRLMLPSSSSSANSSQGLIPEDSESPNSLVPDLRKKILEASNICNIFAQATLLLDDESRGNDEELLKTIHESIKMLNNTTAIILYLQSTTRISDKRTRDEEEFFRIGKKVDRALERLRRSSLKCIESTLSSISRAVISAVRELLLQSVACWRTCLTTPPLGASIAKDALTRTLDTLFILSRTNLNVQDPQTFVPAFEYLSTAAAILDTVPVDSFLADDDNEIVDMANYMRCVSGAFYNLAGSLFQATRYGAAVPFLKESCALGGKALRLPRPASKSTNEKEWQQLEEQLFRRWELLAACYSKNGDRKNSYHALLQAIHTFPFSSSGLLAQSDKLAPDALFGQSASSAVKQLVSLVDRISYIGSCDLLLPTEEVSLKSALNCATTPESSHGANPTIVDPRIVGALLERQLDSLELSRWKESVRGVFVKLLRDALDVYRVEGVVDGSNGMPVRRARVLVRCMEFVYRDHGQDEWSAFGFANVDEIGCEIERLVMMSDLGMDTLLACYGAQYRMASRLWMALHAHRRADPEQNALMTQHADEACRLIKELLAGGGAESSPIRKLSSPKALKKTSITQVRRAGSPKTTRTTRLRVPAAPRKAAPVKSKTALNPKTPNSRTRIAPMQPVSFNAMKTPPRRSMELPSIKSKLLFDNFDKLLELLQLTARILGFLMLILPKAHILDMSRKLSQRQNGITSDGYITASIDLAHEYVALGKLRRASSIFNQALEVVRGRHASPEVAVRFLLRYSESLAMAEEVPKSATVYLEALEISSELDIEQQQGMSTQQRIHARARILEMAAMASHTFAAIQHSKGDVVASLDGLVQSIRLWNRAADTLIRLNPSSRSRVGEESDPFSMTSLKEALLSGGTSKDSQEQLAVKKNTNRLTAMDGLEWRISEGLLSALFSLSRVYHLGGSAREAEYFAQKAADIAEELNLPAMVGRALAKKGEVQLQMGKLEEAHTNLTRAEELLRGMPGIDTADIRRLKADYQQRTTQEENVELEFAGTVTMLEELDAAFRQFDTFAFGPRRSLVTSPRNKGGVPDVLAPDLLASVLGRQLWLLRDDVGDAFNTLLEKLLSLSYSTYNKAEETALMAKLTLHGVYGRFQADMFLSSLTESPIAVPMGMLSTGQFSWTLPSPDILDALANAEKLLWSHLNLMAQKGSVVKIREAAILLALVGAFQTSLGIQRNKVPWVMASLLDASTALSLRRDMLIAIQHKIPVGYSDDLEWPLLAEDGAVLPRLTTSKSTRSNPALSLSDSEDEGVSDDSPARDRGIEAYWESIRTKYQSQILDFSTLSSSRTVGLPANWTIISISVTHDKGTLFISRQEGGKNLTDPLIFCVPLTGRRDHGSGEDDGEQLSFENAVDELGNIVHSSNESTKVAINIKSDDGEARSDWWKQRSQLDVRMKELMENIEYCWLGAFKTILNPRPKLSKENIIALRGQLDKIFHLALRVKDIKTKPPTTKSHKKSVSQTPSANHVMLDDAMIECFSTLSPKCRDEELEDLVYFILDLYQFHGVPVAIAEVDIDQVVVDLRAVLEEHSTKRAKEKKISTRADVAKGSTALSSPSDEHLFLVLDKNVQGLPWESMPILRGRSVSRIPGVDFLHDRIAFAKLKREARGQIHNPEDGAAVDASSGYYILNPSGDLGHTEDRFREWSKDMRKMGWDGVIGRPMSELEFVKALRTRDLVVYFGHGGGEQYVRSHRIRTLPTCAATMLWGCSSGALRDMGDFDRTGTPYNYMLAGCPTLVANLWDVTDKDIDKFSQTVFDKLSLSSMKEKRSSNHKISIVAAVAQSRDSCKLKYLTGAAPVVYGIPFYL